MKKLKSWFLLAVVALVVTPSTNAQDTPHGTLDYTEADIWHHSYLEDDEERNHWTVVVNSYSRVAFMTYVNLNPPSWTTTSIATMNNPQGAWTYSTSTDGGTVDTNAFYFEPEYFERTCMAYDEEGAPLMGSVVTTTTGFSIVNSISRWPNANKNLSPFGEQAKILWQWIPVDENCGEEGGLVTQLSSAAYSKDSSTSVASPNTQARIVTFIAGRFPTNLP